MLISVAEQRLEFRSKIKVNWLKTLLADYHILKVLFQYKIQSDPRFGNKNRNVFFLKNIVHLRAGSLAIIIYLNIFVMFNIDLTFCIY